MAITLPFGIRLAAGLLGTAIDRAAALPAELPSMAVTFAGQALRTSMRIQQELAGLATRGDELLAPLTGRSQEHPEWATFDEDLDDEPFTPRPAGSDATAASPASSRSDADSDDPVLTLLDGTLVVDIPEPGTTGPGEAVPTAAGFVVGASATPASLTGGTTAPLTGGTTAALTGAAPGDVIVPDEAAAPPGVANARRTTTTRARGRSAIRGDHKLTIAELKERTQRMSVAEVQALLAQEEAGPNRAAYLTLLGNRVMTLQHEDR